MAINKHSVMARFHVDGLGTFAVVILEWGAKVSTVRFCGLDGQKLFGDSKPMVPTADLLEF